MPGPGRERSEGLSVRLSVCLSSQAAAQLHAQDPWLPAHPLTHPSIHPSVHPPLPLPLHLSTTPPSIPPFLCPSLSFPPSVPPSVHLSVPPSSFPSPPPHPSVPPRRSRPSRSGQEQERSPHWDPLAQPPLPIPTQPSPTTGLPPALGGRSPASPPRDVAVTAVGMSPPWGCHHHVASCTLRHFWGSSRGRRTGQLPPLPSRIVALPHPPAPPSLLPLPGLLRARRWPHTPRSRGDATEDPTPPPGTASGASWQGTGNVPWDTALQDFPWGSLAPFPSTSPIPSLAAWCPGIPRGCAAPGAPCGDPPGEAGPVRPWGAQHGHPPGRAVGLSVPGSFAGTETPPSSTLTHR